MNNLLLWILSLPSHEWTGNLTDNPLKYFFHSYGDVIGLDVFFTFLFGVIGIAMFIHSNHSKSITIGYFLLIQVFLLAILPSPFTIIMFVFVALLSAAASYVTFFKKQV